MPLFDADVNESEFQQAVIDRSREVPVLVDFWATWCGPCKVLKPVLEKLAAEYEGKFFLAKVETDTNPNLAMSYGIRGVPAVKAFVNGEIVDEFSGALPEGAIREFLERVIPSPGETLRLEAETLHRAGDTAQALHCLAQASELDPGNEKIHISAAAIMLDAGEHAEARRLLESLRPATRLEEPVVALLARLQFSEKGDGDEDALRKAIAGQPDNLDARLELANLLVAKQDYEGALEQLLEIVRRDRSFRDDAGRKTMLSVFTLLSGQGELVSKYRRLLATALN